jgi:hypothetical protein
MVSAIEDIDIVVAVDPDPADLLERSAIRQLRPVGIDLISIVAASHDHRHIPSGDRFSLPQYEAQNRRKGKRGEALDSEIKRKARELGPGAGLLAGSSMVVPSLSAEIGFGRQMNEQHADRAANSASAMTTAADIVGEEHFPAAAPMLLFNFESAGKYDE